jgi:hypothetical protein
LLPLVAIAIHPLLETGANTKLGTTKKGAHKDQPDEKSNGARIAHRAQRERSSQAALRSARGG